MHSSMIRLQWFEQILESVSKPAVLIIGGGTLGTSTAYHLALRGYASVTVLDSFEVCSADLAATDLNKVIHFECLESLYTPLGLEALSIWKDHNSLFSGLYHESGVIFSGPEANREWLESTQNTMLEPGRQGLRYMTSHDMRQQWPMITGQFPGCVNVWSPDAGWVS